MKHYILPGKLTPVTAAPAIPLYEKVYSFWKTSWEQEMIRKLKADPRSYVTANDFLRQDAISVVTDGLNIVGFILHTFYTLESPPVLECKYFSEYTPEALDRLKSDGIRHISTQEYFFVNPAYRQSSAGIKMGYILVGLSTRLARAVKADALLSIARVDVKSHEIVQSFGAIPLCTHTKNNVAVEMNAIYVNRSIEHADNRVDQLVDKLWESTRDYSHLNVRFHENSLLQKVG